MEKQYDTIRVGVLGGGQLGRMMAIAGHNINVEVIPLDPKGLASPAGQVASSCVHGSFKDQEKIKILAEKMYQPGDESKRIKRVMTVEIEHVNCDAMDAIQSSENIPIYPSPATVRLIQDKYVQKDHMRKSTLNIPTSDFQVINNVEDGKSFGTTYGYPYMLKARTDAYDGKGNYVVKNEQDVENGINDLSPATLYAESWCDFDREIAVMVLRGRDDALDTIVVNSESGENSGLIAAYPVVEFSAKDSICRTTLCPAQISKETEKKAIETAMNVIRALPKGAVGVFGVELFAMKDGSVLYNEVAPRPHNSGHYTIEACQCSQFEAHLRAVTGLPFPKDLSQRVGVSIMVNTVGLKSEEYFSRLIDIEGAAGHWYGKDASRLGRKMGHVTICNSTISKLNECLLPVKDILDESNGFPISKDGPPIGIIMGSDSDLPTMKAASEILNFLKVPHEVTVVSAHRTPRRMYEYAESARSRGIKVIIAGAGGAAHLPGMVAALTTLPVIGVPVKTSTLNGIDSLLSIVQMPRGIPVATVAIGNSKNAGLLAARMLGAMDEDLANRIQKYQEESAVEVKAKASKLEEVGPFEYSWP